MIRVVCENVSKKYRLGQRSTSLRDAIPNMFRHFLPGKGPKEFFALKGIDIAIHSGETIGIVGRNGAGKSTLLKILARVLRPNEGTVRINGVLVPLLELGAGFHPEFTGRENAYLNGALMGMRRSDIEQKMSSIMEFSDIGQFMDVPIKRFSSGMRVRLGFAIACHMNPDILLVDEVLSVGDISFQNKCLRKFEEFRDENKTVVFVSHNLEQVAAVCGRCYLLEHGSIVNQGPTDDVLASYRDRLREEMSRERVISDASGRTAVIRKVLLMSEGAAKVHFRMDVPMTIEIVIDVFETIERPAVEVHINKFTGMLALANDTKQDSFQLGPMSPGRHTVRLTYESMTLGANLYFVSLSLRDDKTGAVIDSHERRHDFFVENTLGTRGNFHIPHGWDHSYAPFESG